MKKLIYINSFSGSLQIFIGILLVFVSIPLFIKVFGNEIYGIFSILLLIGNLNSFTNLGIVSSLMKYLAEQGKIRQSNYDIVISFTTLLLIGFLFSSLLLFFREIILIDLLSIPKKYYNNDLLILYYSLLLSNLILFIGQTGVAILDSLQKVYLTNILQTIYNFCYWGFILIILIWFPTFYLIGLGILISSFIWLIILIVLVLRNWNYFDLSGLKGNILFTFRKNLSYGSKIYLSGLINFFFEPLSKILISSYLGITEVGYYDIVLRVKTQLMNLISKIFYPLVPYISAEKDSNKVKRLIQDISNKITFLIIPILVISYFASPTIVKFWLGNDLSLVAVSISYLICAYLLSLIMLPNYQYLTFKGYPGKTIIMQLSNVTINVILFLTTYKHLGFYAIILGNIGALIISTLQGLYYQKKYLNNFIFYNFSELIKWGLILLLTFLTGLLLTYIFNDIIHIILLIVCVFLVYLYLLRQLRIFNFEDIKRYFGQNDFANSISKFLLK